MAIPNFGNDGVLTLLEMEVIAPSFVRIEGAWINESCGIVATGEHLLAITPDFCLALRGSREPNRKPFGLAYKYSTIRVVTGAINTHLFGFMRGRLTLMREA